MRLEQFRQWLKQHIAALKTPEEPDMVDWAEAASIVEKAAATALALGLPEVYRKCHFTTQIDVSPVLTPRMAREILADCLAGLPTEQTATITVKQLIELTGWSRATIYRYRKEGRIPEPRNEGKQLYWLRSELKDIL